MNKKKKIFIITIIVVMVFSICVGLYINSPHYILQYSSKPYIAEAEQFFNYNLTQLRSLTELAGDTDTNIRYRYTFHYPQYTTPGIPADIEAVLLKIEKNIEKPYAVEIYGGNIEVIIENDTHLIVYLTYSIPPFDYAAEHQREYNFGEGWILHTIYIMRG